MSPLADRRWARAKAGDGEVVLISGEPDLHKSRVIAALDELVRAAASSSVRSSVMIL